MSSEECVESVVLDAERPGCTLHPPAPVPGPSFLSPSELKLLGTFRQSHCKKKRRKK